MKLFLMMKLNLSKNNKYILTCSFGPDSMCLFDLLIKGHYDFMVAHVNYHLRKEEPGEVKILKKLCKENKIPIDILNVRMPKGVNEEGWARDVRYKYFSDVAKKYKIQNVLVAHNEDDLLETYLLQKRRGNIVSFYGLKESYFYQNAKIIRPFLKIPKAELRNYCDQNKVPYGLDLSNFDTHYARNKIRKEIVKDMPRNERDAMLKEINEKNEAQKERTIKLTPFIINGEILIDDAKSLNEDDFYFLLILYFDSLRYFYPLSRKFSNEICKIIKTKTTWHKKFDEETILSFDYGVLKLYRLKYMSYSFKSSSKLIKINKKSKLYNLVKDKEIIIKNGLKSNEIYHFNNISKKVGRCFIDWKVPYVYRLLWPAIYDNDGNILYIPHYQKVINLTKDSLLIFNLKDFLK